MRDLIIEHPAGMPVLLHPLRGTSSEATDFGQIVHEPLPPWRTTYGTPSLGADRALSSAENLPKLADTSLQWRPRGPATWRDAQAVVAQAAPQTRAPRTAGSRSHVVGSSAGGIAQRWLLLSSAQRQPQAQRTVDTPWRKHRHQEVSACQTLGRTALACAADAPPARTRFAAGWQTTLLHDSPVGPTPPSGKRGRPGPGAQPDQSVSHSTGAWASRLTDRRARVDPQRGLLLATHERDEGQ